KQPGERPELSTIYVSSSLHLSFRNWERTTNNLRCRELPCGIPVWPSRDERLLPCAGSVCVRARLQPCRTGSKKVPALAAGGSAGLQACEPARSVARAFSPGVHTEGSTTTSRTQHSNAIQ